MEHQKITRKWNIVNDWANSNYDVRNEITYNKEILESNICDYNDAYILVRGAFTVTAVPSTQVSFKNCEPFTKCITKIDETTIDDAENLGLVMPMYDLTEYNSNYYETKGSLWFYSKDKETNFNDHIENTDNFKYFKYKAKQLGNTVAQPASSNANGLLKKATIPVLTKCLSNI